MESGNYRATALRPAQKVVFFEEVLGNRVSKNLPKLGWISEDNEKPWMRVSNSYRPCWLFYPEFCIAASHPGKFGHISFFPCLLSWWFRPQAMRRGNSCHCNLCRTNKCDSDTKGRMLLVILTGHKKSPRLIHKSSWLTPFLTDPAKIRIPESAAGYSQNLYSLRQLL